MSDEARAVTKRHYEVLAEFRFRLRSFFRYCETISRRHGLTPLQYQLMLHIKGYPGRDWATVGELATRMQAKHNGTVSLITRCQKRGVVTRQVDPRDRRLVQIRLTPRGEKVLARLAQLHWDELLALRNLFVVHGLDSEL
jgi:DNA-binding MarR family transcriptional regulator